MKQQWDGVNQTLWTQFIIGGCVIVLLIDRFTGYDPDHVIFGMAIFHLIAAIFMVPEGPQPPE